jgi:adenine phosphoribosyltransferase
MKEPGISRPRLNPVSSDAGLELPAPRPVGIRGRTRGLLGNPLDGRFGGPMNPSTLAEVIARLIERLDLAGVDCVVGFPEGGVIPAYAFAAASNLPLVAGSLHQLNLPGAISFTEQHNASSQAKIISLYGLAPGSRVIVVEDELTTGRTIVNCVRALRAAEVGCDQVVTIYAVDDPALGACLAEEGIELHAALLFSRDIRDGLTTAPSDARS